MKLSQLINETDLENTIIETVTLDEAFQNADKYLDSFDYSEDDVRDLGFAMWATELWIETNRY